VDWNKVRQEFPSLQERVFLDAACASLLPKRAADAVTEFTTRLVAPETKGATEHHIWMDQQRDAALPRLATMLGCPVEQLAIVENTSQGLNVAALAIPWRKGDEVIVCDLEFLQVAIPFCKLEASHKIKPVFVTSRNGTLPPEVFDEAVTARTRAIVVSSTQWNNGYRVDLGALAEIARKADAWLIVDGVQQAGAIPFELDGVDFLTSGGHKWLNAPMGAGFLYLSQRALQELDPVSWGYLTLQPPDGGWGNYFTTPSITPDREYQFVKTARRFETGGTGNYPGAIALAKSVELVNEVGIKIIAERIWQLGNRLLAGLRQLPVKQQSDFPRANRAGIISFTFGDRDKDRACVEHLLARGIWVGQRYTSNVGGVRISVHYFNNEDDIDTLLKELKQMFA
jgi:selenocysteine lyase/cysteine desulfurase